MIRTALNSFILLTFMLVLFNHQTGLSDDVGITKARLIQKTDNSYILEVDVPEQLVWTIKAPIFPDRFQVSEPQYLKQGGLVVMQTEASTEGEPLSSKDEILLPWARNGADLTSQWLDGSIRKGLFIRSLEGIHVPLRLLMPSETTTRELLNEHIYSGLKHFAFNWIHILLVLVLVLLLPFKQLFNALVYYALGEACSLILADFGLSGFNILFVDILGLLLIFLLAYVALKQKPARSYIPLLFLFGLLHGLAYAQELSVLGLGSNQKLQALFFFNIAIDIAIFTTAVLMAFIVKQIDNLPHIKKIATYVSGVLSVVLLFVLFQDHVIAGNTDILNFSGRESSTQFAMPGAKNPGPGVNRPPGARELTKPVMVYMSVEPQEVRLEILMQARAAVQFLGAQDKGMGSIPVESLEQVKKGITGLIKNANLVSIDGKSAEPVLARADFVTLGPAGVMLREKPVKESLDNGIVGLSLVFETSGMPDEITVDWRLFSENIYEVEFTTSDPFGGSMTMLSPDDNKLRWKSRISGYRVPVVEEIPIEQLRLPVVSAFIFIIVFIFFILSIFRKKRLIGRPVLLSFAGIAFVLYPFLRFPIDSPVATQWKPSTERTSVIMDRLLTNVYSSFDYRDEDDVYDRLATSVLGDQLADIYLENRQSLELENRGGAKAKVDEVEIQSVNKVAKSEDGGFTADLNWTVSGSVSHFGHTHYRKNQYHALVTFVTDGDTWKIKDIDLIEEKRLF